MARPPQEAIETFMSITGASEAVALEKLEEHGGNLNEAVNSHFSEGDRLNPQPTSVPAHDNDFMDIDQPIDVEAMGSSLPLLSASRNLNPFSLLDPIMGRSLFDNRGVSGFDNRAPHVSHPKEVREIPIEFKDEINQSGSSNFGPTIEDVTGSAPTHEPEVQGTVIVDDDDEDLPSSPSGLNEREDNDSHERHPRPSAPQLVMSDYNNNEIEEEMIRAAIEASKREAEIYTNPHFGMHDQQVSPQPDQASPVLEDVELAHAVSLSLKTAEQEKALREQGLQVEKGPNISGVKMEVQKRMPIENERQGFVPSTSGMSHHLKSEEGSSSFPEDAEDVEEQPLVRNRSRHFTSGANESANETGKVVDIPPASSESHDIGDRPQHNRDAFPSDEWGGISSEEHDEAVMLEAAMFGGVPERSSYSFAYPSPQALQSVSEGHPGLYPQIPRAASPTLAAQRLLREQQDDEYLAALQADREKELKAMQDAEVRRLEEAAAREAALEQENHRQEETRRKLLEEEEFEREIAAKQASIPPEPPSDGESTVTILVRMPDGSRCGRRFLKSDKLQSLFDFIDVGRVVKPHTYRLVRPYPRRAFSDGEGEISLSDLGLTSRQEALFLELM